MKLDDLPLTPVPGDGVLCRLPGAVILALPGADQIERADDLVALCRDVVTTAGGPPGRMLARRLAGLLSAADTAPAFCALGQAEAGIAVFVHGDVAVDIDLPAGPLTLSGRDAATWVDRIVDESFTAVTARHADGGPLAPDHRFDLRQGVTPASAFMLGRTGEGPPEEEDQTAIGAVTVAPPPPPPPPAEEAPVAPAAQGVEFEAVSLIEPAPEPEHDHAHDHVHEAREPLPLAAEPAPEPAPVAESVGVEVDGIVCSRGHFNDPDSLFCSSCGISMVQQTHNLVKGPRPPLGFLVFDDGQTYQVDADYVIGRDPDGDDAVSSGRARPLVLDDAEGGISRRHASIELEGWQVVFADRGSTNGTYVWDAGSGQWRRLGTGERVAITPGTRLALGRRTMVFESPHER